MANVPTDPPSSRSFDFGALVREALGDEYHKHEKVYQFRNGRRFLSSDYGTSGVYSSTTIASRITEDSMDRITEDNLLRILES